MSKPISELKRIADEKSRLMEQIESLKKAEEAQRKAMTDQSAKDIGEAVLQAFVAKDEDQNDMDVVNTDALMPGTYTLRVTDEGEVEVSAFRFGGASASTASRSSNGDRMTDPTTGKALPDSDAAREQRKLFREGMSVADISAKFQTSTGAVYRNLGSKAYRDSLRG